MRDGSRSSSRGPSWRRSSRGAVSVGTGGTAAGGEEVQTMKVFVRVRPLLEGEASDSDNMRSLRLLPDGRSVYIRDRYVDEKVMEFNRVFGPETHQKAVFEDVGLPACTASLEGQYGTVITYGQTGTGKTYTAFGMDPGREGLMHRCVHNIFARVAADRQREWEVSVQYLQIYKDQVTDLLDEQGSVEIREDFDRGVYVKGATNVVVASAEHALEVFGQGNRSRVVRLTTMNAQSSRSHALFMLSLKCRAEPHLTTALCGRLTLVDLAGSERIKRTKADSLRRQEAQSINMSLSCLGTVIHALTDNKSTHIPYRSCKLTRILRDSLGEHGRASIVVTISPALCDVAETLGSLYFGSRALCVKQTQRVHMLPDQSLTNTAEMRQKLTDLTLGKSNLEDQVAFLAADNTQLRDAAHADEYLIEELSAHLTKATHRQDESVIEKKQLDEITAKLEAQKKQMRAREEAVEAVFEEELRKQGAEYAAQLRDATRSRDDRIATLERENASLRERILTLEHITTTPPPDTPPHASRSPVHTSPPKPALPIKEAPSPPMATITTRGESVPSTWSCRDSSTGSSAVGVHRFESIEQDMENIRRQHSTEVAHLRETLDEHRVKLEEAQAMLRRCSPSAERTERSSSASTASTVGYLSSSPPPPPPRSQSPTLQSTVHIMQKELLQEKTSLFQVRQEYDQLQERAKEMEVSRQNVHNNLAAVQQENERMRAEKSEERRLLHELIRERDALKEQVSQPRSGSSVSVSPSLSLSSYVGSIMSSAPCERGARIPYRGPSLDSVEEREPILGTFASAPDGSVSPSSTAPSTVQKAKLNPLPSFEHFFSSAALLQED